MNPSFGIHFEPVFKSPSLSGVATHYQPKRLTFIPVSAVSSINNGLVPTHCKRRKISMIGPVVKIKIRLLPNKHVHAFTF